MSDEHDYAASIPLPPGSVAQYGVLVVAYFTPEGDTCYGLMVQGDTDMAGSLGLLELAKAHLLAEHPVGD